MPTLGKRLFDHRPAVTGLAQPGGAGWELVRLTAGTHSLATQKLNEAARRFTPDRFAIPALKGPVAELFKLKDIAHSQDAVDQLPVLTFTVSGLTALDVGDLGLGLPHSA